MRKHESIQFMHYFILSILLSNIAYSNKTARSLKRPAWAVRNMGRSGYPGSTMNGAPNSVIKSFEHNPLFETEAVVPRLQQSLEVVKILTVGLKISGGHRKRPLARP